MCALRYHPHHHGSTAIQAGGAAAGAIIVEDAANTLPDSVAALEEMVFVMAHVNMPELIAVAQARRTAFDLCPPHVPLHAINPFLCFPDAAVRGKL